MCASAASRSFRCARSPRPCSSGTRNGRTFSRNHSRFRPMASAPFWKTKKLAEMTPAEWESLCDGCAKCCLVKLEDEETKELFFTSLRCKLLDPKTCRCSDYANRKKHVPICVKLTPKVVAEV